MSKRKMTSNKTTKTNKTNKTTKKSKLSILDKSDIDNFGKVYGWALYSSAYCWNFHTDSMCFDELCEMQTYKKEQWTAIFQPSKAMKEGEEGKYYVLFKHEKDITEETFTSLKPIVDHVNKLFLESYNDILKITNNKWSKTVNGTIEEVAQLIYPLKLESKNSSPSINGKILKMCFELRGMCKNQEWRSNDCWIPEKLAQWLGYKKKADSLFDDDGELKKDLYCVDGLPETLGYFTDDAISAII